jgi:hypothetical protein
VSNKHGHREEREVSRKTIARGMPGETGVTVVTTLVFCFFTHEAAGALSARHSLRPLIPRGEVLAKPRAHRAAGSRGHIWIDVIARSKATKQSILPLWAMDCFAYALNDGLNTHHTFNRHRPRRRTIQYSGEVRD